MVGTGKRSSYRKKRKGKGFGGSRRSVKSSKKAPVKESETNDRSRPGTSVTELEISDVSDSSEDSGQRDQPLSSSRKKMKLHISTDESSGSSDDDNETEVDTVGYRLVDLKNLSSVLCTVHKCKEGGFTIYKACDYYIKVAPVSFTFH